MRGICNAHFFSLLFYTASLSTISASLYANEGVTTHVQQQAITEPPQALSLNDAIALAQKFDPTQAVLIQKQQLAEANLQQSGLRTNPELTVSATGFKRPTVSNNSVSGQSLERTLALSQPVDLYSVRTAKIALAQNQMQTGSLQAANYRAQLSVAVTAAFNQVSLAEQQLQIATMQQQLETQTLQVAQKRFAAGKIAELELTRLQISLSQADSAKVQASVHLMQARQTLTRFWGNDTPQFSQTQMGQIQTGQSQASQSTLTDPHSPVLITALDLQALKQKHSPDLPRQLDQALHQEMNAQELLVKRVAKPMPTISIGLRQTLDVDRRDNQLMIGASIPLPLFNRNQGHIEAAKIATQLAAQQSEIRLDQREQVIARLQAQYNQSQQRYASITNEQLPQLQNLQQKTLTGFAAGKFNVMDLLQVQRDVLQLRSEALQRLGIAMNARLQIEAVMIGLAPDTDLSNPYFLNTIQNELINQGLADSTRLAGVTP